MADKRETEGTSGANAPLGTQPGKVQGTGKVRGLVPLAISYTSYGYFWGTWSVVYLSIVRSHGFSFSVMSWYLTALTIASMATMVFVSPRIAHLSPSLSLPLALFMYALGMVAFPWANGALLLIAFAVLGVGTGLIDVLVNQVGHNLEVNAGRSVLQWVHASYSAGIVVGTLVSAVILTMSKSPDAFREAIVVAAATQVASLLLCATSPAFRAIVPGERARERSSLSAFTRDRSLLIVALIVLSAFFVEGSLDVWAVTYLRLSLSATILGGALGFCAFGISTGLGRAFAARILFGMGYRRTIMFSGLGSLAAGAIAVTAPTLWIATIGYLLLGFCLASAAPAAFGTVGGEGAQVGVSIAAVTTVGYLGFVIGPPVMGWLADAFDVRATMMVITIAALGIAVGGYLSRGRVSLAAPEDDAAHL
jgi:MFS family permease